MYDKMNIIKTGITTRIVGMSGALRYFLKKDKGYAEAYDRGYLQALQDMGEVVERTFEENS